MLVHLFVRGAQIFVLLFKPKGDPFHLCKRQELLSQRSWRERDPRADRFPFP